MNASRTSRAALFWSAAETTGQQSVQLLVYIVLARLIKPSEFGLTALLAIFFAVGQSLADGGFSNALIQKKNADEVDRCTVFYFNLFVGLVLACSLFASGGFIADYYGAPVLKPLCQYMSLMFLATSSGLVQQAITRKELDFLPRAKASVVASIGSGAISITMAAMGYGVWALATQMILMRLLQSSMLWLLCDWRPKSRFSLHRLRQMFGFGSKMLAASLLSAVFANIYALVIGKAYSITDVGYYSNAKRYQEYPANNLTTIFNRVSFPAFSKFQDDKDHLRELFKNTVRTSSMFIFPVMALLCGIARPLFETVLSAKWLPSVPLFQVLCVAGVFQPIAAINLSCLLALGKSGNFLALEIVKRSLSVLALLITYRFGIFWIVVGEASLAIVHFFINTFFTGRYLSVNGFQQFRVLAPSFLLSACILLAAFAGTTLATKPVWQCLIGAFSGLVAGTLFAVLFLGLSVARLRHLLSNWKTVLGIV